MGDLANNSEWQIIFAIAAAAAFSCVVGWFVNGGFAWLGRKCQRWLTGAPAAPSRPASRPVDTATRQFGDEFVRALTLAINTYADLAADEEAIIEAIIDAIVAQLGWSETRARWFFAVNRDQVEQAAREWRTKRPEHRPPCAV